MTWTLHVNRSSNNGNCDIGLVLRSLVLEHLKIEYVLRLRFNVSNNEVEYEALLIGLRLTQVVGAKLLVSSMTLNWWSKKLGVPSQG